MRNPDVYFVGCSYHMAHNAARKLGDSFSGSSGFDVEDLVVDQYYWFDKNTKRKNELNEFCVFSRNTCKHVLRHASTHWVSLQNANSRTLEMYQHLSGSEYSLKIP